MNFRKENVEDGGGVEGVEELRGGGGVEEVEKRGDG